MSERDKRRNEANGIERCRKLVFIAAAAKLAEKNGGEICGEPFAVFTSEMAKSLLKQTFSLGRFIDFVVSYEERGRIKYSVLESVGGDEIVLLEPEGRFESTIPLDLFMKDWKKADNWIMMVRKERSGI
ncbi:MAG TPA: hypothetical protein VJ227_00975 [Patescibacteria group bacterium]|nr:hypothetical protein [Patescibacteria group bacterium]